LTQCGSTGTTFPLEEKLPEFDGLKTSAVAVALTLLPALPQMREKYVGRFDRDTLTVTMGLTPKA
jgi:hypothetical protein